MWTLQNHHITLPDIKFCPLVSSWGWWSRIATRLLPRITSLWRISRLWWIARLGWITAGLSWWRPIVVLWRALIVTAVHLAIWRLLWREALLLGGVSLRRTVLYAWRRWSLPRPRRRCWALVLEIPFRVNRTKHQLKELFDVSLRSHSYPETAYPDVRGKIIVRMNFHPLILFVLEICTNVRVETV
jgi:hypothetical protein